MVIRNIVDLELTALGLSRMLNYFCFIGAAVCIGFCTIELIIENIPIDSTNKFILWSLKSIPSTNPVLQYLK